MFAGAAGWGEFCPFDDYDDRAAVPWLAAAVEAAEVGWPAPVRDRIPVNCTVPAVGPERAHRTVAASGCGTAKVKVADHPGSAAEDEERVRAVRDALGPSGRIRVDANAAWGVDEAVRRIAALDRAADGLEYVEQPCPTVPELARVRRRVEVRIAADESIRRAEDPLRVAVAEAADVAVLKCTPLGGVRRALRVAEACGLPCVVSSALQSSVGLAAEVALAAALPRLDFACGLGTRALLAADLVDERDQLDPVNGELPVRTSPPAPEAERLARHRATAERDRWWRERLDRVWRLYENGVSAPDQTGSASSG